MVAYIDFYGQQLKSVTCHNGSHSATCHPTQVNATSQKSQYSIYLPRRNGRLSWPWWCLYIYRVGQKNRTCLSVDNSAMVSGRKVERLW